MVKRNLAYRKYGLQDPETYFCLISVKIQIDSERGQFWDDIFMTLRVEILVYLLLTMHFKQ